MHTKNHGVAMEMTTRVAATRVRVWKYMKSVLWSCSSMV